MDSELIVCGFYTKMSSYLKCYVIQNLKEALNIYDVPTQYNTRRIINNQD